MKALVTVPHCSTFDDVIISVDLPVCIKVFMGLDIITESGASSIHLDVARAHWNTA